jgi:hypothetical protein
MRTKTLGKVKVDPELMADFAGCLEDDKFSVYKYDMTDEMRALIVNVYAKKECNRKEFFKKFKAKYGICRNTLRAMIKREGIDVENGRNW